MNVQKERRKKFLIYKSVQWELLKVVLWSNLLTVFAIAGAGVAFVFTIQNLAAEQDWAIMGQALIILKDLSWVYAVYLMTGIICVLVISIYAWIRISHTIAGPLYHIRKNLEEYKQNGTFEEIKLRKNDKILDIADLINSAIAKSKGPSDANKI